MSLEREVFHFIDALGPEKVIYVYDPKTAMKGIVVVDNTARGPSIGGVRMASDVTTEEVVRLARAMTLKNSAADIQHGGGKSAILADPNDDNRQNLLRAFAGAIIDIEDYIPGPDMGTKEEDMAIFYTEIGRVVGLPKDLGGIPLDEIGSTGYGVSIATSIACEYLGLKLGESTVAIEGFGAVGKAIVKYLSNKGAKIVAVSDSKGTIYNPDGLDYNELLRIKAVTGAVKNYEEGRILNTQDLFRVPVDILIPGARPDVITKNNVDELKSRLIVEAANIPATEEAEQILAKRGVLVIPDFIANSGGVITAAVEYRGGTAEEAFDLIRLKISSNTQEMLDMVFNQKMLPREAAERIAKRRIHNAMRLLGRM